MDEYKQRQQKKYLEQKKIQIEEDEKVIREKQEKLDKIREEQTKKQVYIHSQLLIIDESIDSFKTDKTDDNIMLILTNIKASFENIQKMISEDEKKIILDQVLKFTAEVDKNNAKRPKGVNTIANVKILKDSFKQIYDMLNLQVDIQTLDIDDDEKIARELEKEINKAKHPKINHEFEEENEEEYNIDAMPVPAPMPFPIPMPKPIHNDLMEDTDEEDEQDDEQEEHHQVHQDNHGYDEHEEEEEEEEDDETIARRLQEELNRPEVKEPVRKRTVPRHTKYEGLSCEEFIVALSKEPVSSF